HPRPRRGPPPRPRGEILRCTRIARPPMRRPAGKGALRIPRAGSPEDTPRTHSALQLPHAGPPVLPGHRSPVSALLSPHDLVYERAEGCLHVVPEDPGADEWRHEKVGDHSSRIPE